MRTLYLDCFAGIAGDMFIGALLDTGIVSKEDFIDAMKGIALEGYSLEIERSSRAGMAGTDFKVQSDEHHPHRHLSHIIDIIDGSHIPSEVKTRSKEAFTYLAKAESEVHGSSIESVHFHEVGAVDSIVDVIGSFLLLNMMNIDRVVSSRVNVGSGTVKCDHGVMPVPAPATTKLLMNIPIYSEGEPMERTTPTGALILKTVVDSFSSVPDGKIVASGHGLGDRDTKLANLLRVYIVEENSCDFEPDQVAVLESNIDDMNPQDYGPLMDRLFEAGALDVFFTPIIMKKERPGVRVTVVSPVKIKEEMARIILRHSTSIGVRFRLEDRVTLKRSIEEKETSMGTVRVKNSFWGDELFQSTIEFEDVKKIALERKLPVAKIREALKKEI